MSGFGALHYPLLKREAHRGERWLAGPVRITIFHAVRQNLESSGSRCLTGTVVNQYYGDDEFKIRRGPLSDLVSSSSSPVSAVSSAIIVLIQLLPVAVEFRSRCEMIGGNEFSKIKRLIRSHYLSGASHPDADSVVTGLVCGISIFGAVILY